jgi:hypothetical protein
MFSEGQYTINSDDFSFSSTARGMQKAVRNPSPAELKAGIYLPRCTLMRRPAVGGWRESLTIEFSAPKLLFGNNFDELVDGDSERVIDRLMQALEYLQINIPRADVADAKVIGWHPSKNVILADIFGCKTVINALQGVDVSRTYKVQKTNFTSFTPGEVLHFHCNSKDIAFYDKLADLRRGKVSDKRAIENDNYIQIEYALNTPFAAQ